MSLRKILVLDGVKAVCRFRDDGVVMEAEGMLPPELMERLAKFAQWYRRMVSGNTDLLSLFSQMDLDAPIARVCTEEVPIPYPKHLEDAALPGAERIVATVRRLFSDAQ